MVGRRGVSVVALAGVLGASPEAVMESVMVDMVETRAGADAPAIYCEPTEAGPTLTPRRFD